MQKTFPASLSDALRLEFELIALEPLPRELQALLDFMQKSDEQRTKVERCGRRCAWPRPA